LFYRKNILKNYEIWHKFVDICQNKMAKSVKNSSLTSGKYQTKHKINSVESKKIKSKKNTVASTSVTAFQMQEPAAILLSPETSLFQALFNDKIRTSEAIENGLPYKDFRKIFDIAPFTEDFWANALGISLRSLHRYKQNKTKFKPLQAEKIIEMAEVTGIGKKVFGNNEKFSLWLETPNFVFEGKKPMELLKNSYGKELVISELTQIDQGIFV